VLCFHILCAPVRSTDAFTINKESGAFFCVPHFIINGKVEFNGQIFTK